MLGDMAEEAIVISSEDSDSDFECDIKEANRQLLMAVSDHDMTVVTRWAVGQTDNNVAGSRRKNGIMGSRRKNGTMGSRRKNGTRALGLGLGQIDYSSLAWPS